MKILNTLSQKLLSKKQNALLFSSSIGVLIFLCSKDFGMLQDNVLFCSKMGKELYENSLFNWTMPDTFNPDHPAFIGFLLALSWKIFGKSLFISHLVMLPFIIGVFYQLILVLKFYFDKLSHQLLAFLFIIIDPTFSVQFVLVNPEIIIIFFFLLAFNSLIKSNNKLLFTGFFFLSITTFRGMILFAGFFIYDILYQLIVSKKNINNSLLNKKTIIYALASSSGAIFVVWRLLTKGWLQTHPNSPWKSLWRFADFKTFIRNIALLIHKYVDFGRVFFLSFLLITIFTYGKKNWKNQKNMNVILVAISSVIFVIIASIFSTNFFGHRYFIVSAIFLSILTLSILFNHINNKKVIFSILFIGLLTGNLWIYPREIAQRRGATLAHTPYHSLRKEAIKYLDTQKIEIKNIARFFSNYTTIGDIDLNGDFKMF